MSTKIKGSEYPLAKIFSSDFDYDIPSYQRLYAWTESEAGTLFDDLYDFYKNEDKDENYFLGSIVLIKEDDKPHADIIDGQQRLTTINILLACITYKLTNDDYIEDFKNYIKEPGRASQGLAPKPRLRLRKRDNEFFDKYVQNMMFDDMLKLDPEIQDTEAKTHIIKNTKLFLDKIDTIFNTEEEIVEFGAFLVQRCFLVAVSTPNEQSAFRVFSVMNNRGMSLLTTDIIKADVIGAISEDKQHKYTEMWEDMEMEIGRDEFNDLFGHIRMIKMKRRAKKSLQEEFYKFVLPNIDNATAIDFIENTLGPYAEAYRVIKNNCYMSASGADQVNDILGWLNLIDNSDWIPVAMYFYVRHKDDAELMNAFLLKLERLSAYIRIMSWDVNYRIKRYAAVLEELEQIYTNDFGTSIELTKNEIKLFIQALNSDIYRMTPNKRNYLILRLDSFISDGMAKYAIKRPTIEHVLPQTIGKGSEWEKLWPDESERNKWLHKIGNLVPLTRRRNSSAQNYDFNTKKEKYFRGKGGTTSYSLTTDVLNYQEWTPEVVKNRQDRMIEKFKEGWDLY